MNRLRSLWPRVKDSLWFVPGTILAGSVALAMLLIDAEGWMDLDLAERWPRLFGAGAEGARSMLSAVATSMITVAGVVFSITVLALAQASSQYSPRVLRTFMSDRPTQVVLGVFVGVFAYCLVVLRTVRDGDGDAGFLPAVAVLAGVVFALLAVVLLIYFIHHVAASIQAEAILDRIAGDTRETIARTFPEQRGGANPRATVSMTASIPWEAVRARGSGYLLQVDEAALAGWARERGRPVRIHPRTGEFVVEGQPIAEVGGPTPMNEDDGHELLRALTLGPERTIRQDAAYGLLLIVDVAIKALSPGINDPSTAMSAVDHLTALLACLAPRRLQDETVFGEASAPVTLRGRSFEELVAVSFDRVLEHARGDTAVLSRLLQSLGMLADILPDPQRGHALRPRLALTRDAIRRTVALQAQQDRLLAQAAGVEERLRHVGRDIG
jgi:uncharacterized membrane protein